MRTILSFHPARTLDPRARYGFTVAWASFIVARTPTPLVTTVFGIAINNHKQDNFNKKIGRDLAGKRVFGMLYGLLDQGMKDFKEKRIAQLADSLWPGQFSTYEKYAALLKPITESTGAPLAGAFSLMVPEEALRVFDEAAAAVRPTLDIDFGTAIQQVEILSDRWAVLQRVAAAGANSGYEVTAERLDNLTAFSSLPQQAWWDQMNAHISAVVNSIPGVEFTALNMFDPDVAAGFNEFVHVEDEYTLEFLADDEIDMIEEEDEESDDDREPADSRY